MVSIKRFHLPLFWLQPSLLSRIISIKCSTFSLAVLSLTLLISGLSFGQKIQVKRGIITNNGEAIGKLQGEATFANGTDITIKSMNEELLLHVKSILVNYHNIFYKSLQFYSIDFLPLNLSASLIIDYPFSSERRLIEYLYTIIGSSFLRKDGLDKNQVEKFLASKDESAKINADTTRTFAIRNHEREALRRQAERRDLNGMITLKLVNSIASGSSTQQTSEIYQGSLLIGTITKTITNSAVTPSGPPVMSANYVIKRKVDRFAVDAMDFEFAHLAAINANPNYPLDITVYCERTWAKDLKLPDILAGERQIILWLIEKNCL